MSTKFDNAIPFVLLHECEFAPGHYGDFGHVVAEHDPHDPGGTTKFGIDARDHPGVDVEHLDLAGAKQIYAAKEWTWCGGEQLPEPLGTIVFDACVNPGRRALFWLQQIAGVPMDGEIGPKTIAAVNALPPSRYAAFLDRCEQYYRDLVTQHPATFRRYLTGWLNRNNDRRKLLTA